MYASLRRVKRHIYRAATIGSGSSQAEKLSPISDGYGPHQKSRISKGDKSSSNTRDHVCNRCAVVPWRSMASGDNSIKLVVPESIYQLQQSQCSVCQLLGHFLHLRTTPYPTEHPMSRPTQLYDLPGPWVVESDDLCTKMPMPWPGPRAVQLIVSDTDLYESSDTLPRLLPRAFSPSQVQAWISSCQDKHADRCSPTLRSNLRDLKVIDCTQARVIDAPAECQYTALSYVWGKENNTPKCHSRNDLLGAPQTIVDAMKVTRELGYRYLWVDRYCIAQEDAEVKHIQIAQMGQIYAAAALTIIAAIGHDPSQGLPGIAKSSRAVRSTVSGSSHLTVIPAHMDFDQVLHSPWSKRGWTLQESLLSTRRLILTDRQAIFVCNTQTCYEAESDAQRQDVFAQVGWRPPQDITNKQSPVDTAMFYLQEYSRRTLTYDTDALNAIVGALNTLREKSVSHIWGLPFKHANVHQHGGQAPIGCTAQLSCQVDHGYRFLLGWCHFGPSPVRRRWAFPSWSPIGWEGEINCRAPPKFVTTPNSDEQIEYERYLQSGIPGASPCGVRLKSPAGQQQSLLAFLPDRKANPENISQLLELDGETYTTPLATRDGVFLPFADEFSCHYPANYSFDLSDPEWHGEVLDNVKLLLIRGSSERSHSDRDWLLLLVPSITGPANSYRRIGMAQMDAEVPYLRLCGDDFHRISIDDPSWQRLKMKRDEYASKLTRWWRPCFTPEVVTIV